MQLKIEKLVYGGYGLAHHEGKAILIRGVAPDEIVEVELKYKRKGIWWANLKQIIEPKNRQKPICQHAKECGGCSYQHLNSQNQILIKEKILEEIYENKIQLGQSIISPQEFYYRNKCEFTFGEDEQGNLSLGLHPEGKFFEVLNLKECHLLPHKMWKILQRVKQLAQVSGLKPYKDLKEEGFFSTITLRRSSSSQEVLLIWKVKNPQEKKLLELSLTLQSEFENIKGILAVQAPRGKIVLLNGQNSLSQQIDDLNFIYEAENFFQINTFVLPLLMQEIKNLVQKANPEILYDLFAGVGAIGIYVGKYLPNIQKIIGAESDQKACELAALNAEINNVNNYESHFLNLYKSGWGSFLKKNNKNICVLIDPPRAGLSGKTIKEIVKINPQTIIYVSCNPSTQKRDLDEFALAGYNLESLKLIDMFPQTMHLEAIAYLKKQSY